jgi:energy-coupling factor transport system ATP-binding protein
MIKFSNVTLLYPQSTTTVIENLSFEIAEGEMVLVMGHTGSGKSSLLRLINGLVPHHTGGILAGEISVDGISTRTVRPGALAGIVGIVGQNPINAFVADTVEEEIAFGMESLNFHPDLMRKRVEEALDQVGLSQLRDRNIATLSGGEQQRVAIASALVMHPKVLVLDEPTSALDPIAAEEILSLLQRLVHDLSVTVIIAEHRLERVIGYVDRILLIEGDGESALGVPEEVLRLSKLVVCRDCAEQNQVARDPHDGAPVPTQQLIPSFLCRDPPTSGAALSSCQIASALHVDESPFDQPLHDRRCLIVTVL